MAWIQFVGRDLRDRDRLERAAAAAGFEVRTAAPEAWEPEEAPALVIVDLDRVGVPDGLPSGAQAVGYYSHVNEDLARGAEIAGVTAIPRGKFWSGLDRLLGNL